MHRRHHPCLVSVFNSECEDGVVRKYRFYSYLAGPAGDTEGGDLTEREGRKLDRLVERIQDSAVLLWVLGGTMTACGRVLADVHW